MQKRIGISALLLFSQAPFLGEAFPRLKSHLEALNQYRNRQVMTEIPFDNCLVINLITNFLLHMQQKLAHHFIRVGSREGLV
jgi:hypothetical protein